MQHTNDDDGADSPLVSLQRRRKSRATTRPSASFQAEALSSATDNEDDAHHCVARASWFRDASQQSGMSENDLEEFLGKAGSDGADANEGQNHSNDESDFDTAGIGADISLPMDEMAEQHRLMAMYGAKKLLNQNVGYDVAEAARKTIEQDEEEGPSKPSHNTTKYSCHPEKPIYTVSPKNSTGQQRPILKRRMQPKFDVPIADSSCSSLLGRVAPKHKVAYGTVVDNSEDDWNTAATTEEEEEDRDKILSHCERCKFLLAVPLHAILVVCPQCNEPIF